MKFNRFTPILLVLNAGLLATLAFRPILQPTPVRAQASDAYPFYVEPGYTTIRKPDGTSQAYGKMIIDMRNGDIWGFPTLEQSPYPIDRAKTAPPKSHPMYLGKFMLSEAARSGQ